MAPCFPINGNDIQRNKSKVKILVKDAKTVLLWKSTVRPDILRNHMPLYNTWKRKSSHFGECMRIDWISLSRSLFFIVTTEWLCYYVWPKNWAELCMYDPKTGLSCVCMTQKLGWVVYVWPKNWGELCVIHIPYILFVFQGLCDLWDSFKPIILTCYHCILFEPTVLCLCRCGQCEADGGFCLRRRKTAPRHEKHDEVHLHRCTQVL